MSRFYATIERDGFGPRTRPSWWCSPRRLASNVRGGVRAATGLVRALGGGGAQPSWRVAPLGHVGLVGGHALVCAKRAPPDLRQLLTLTGLATAPAVFNILGFVPLIGWLILMVASIWSLLTAYSAVRVGLATDERGGLAATFISYIANACSTRWPRTWSAMAGAGF